MPKTEMEIRQAFDADGYDVKMILEHQGRHGLLAEHRTARNSKTGAPKKALYVEGDGYQMGYLVGLLAEPDVSRMSTEFVYNVIPDFISPKIEPMSHSWVIQLLIRVIRNWCHEAYTRHFPGDIPAPLMDEMRGIADGCKARNSATAVTFENVLTLNAGIDCLVAAIYTGLGLVEWIEHLIPSTRRPKIELKADIFRLPMACNAFLAFGSATRDGKFYFGRDFQFPAAGVFQDTACLLVYNPQYSFGDGGPALPLVSQAAPGFVGSVVAMNTAGVGVGVNMIPSGNCDPHRPGLNSLLMARYATHCAGSAARAVDAMVAAQRGSSWIYPIGDGTTNRAVVVEAGMTVENLDPLNYPPPHLKPLLPGGPFLPSRRGLYERWDDWQYPTRYIEYNPGLFRHMGYPWNPVQFYERGYINSNWKGGVDQGCFFAPQRESQPDLLVATNNFLVPEMRLCAMNEWTNLLAKNRMPDFIWRYDELNRQCLEAHGQIDEQKAIALANFLAPDGLFGDYYGDHPVIEGSVSLCNLTDRTITSHFGYHKDEWVGLTLPRYV